MRVFDPATGEWTSLAPLPTPRFATHAAVIDGRVYVPTGVGLPPDGSDIPAVLPSLEVFIP